MNVLHYHTDTLFHFLFLHLLIRSLSLLMMLRGDMDFNRLTILDRLFIGCFFSNCGFLSHWSNHILWSNRYKSEKISISGTEYDRRQKLTPEQRAEIYHRYHTEDVSQRQLAREYGVSRRLITFIIDPDKLEASRQRLKQSKAKGLYKPDKRKWAATVREHRQYKQQLYKQGKIQMAI